MLSPDEIEFFKNNPPPEVIYTSYIDIWNEDDQCYYTYRSDGRSVDQTYSIQDIINELTSPNQNSYHDGLKKAIKEHKFNTEMKEIINEKI